MKKKIKHQCQLFKGDTTDAGIKAVFGGDPDVKILFVGGIATGKTVLADICRAAIENYLVDEHCSFYRPSKIAILDELDVSEAKGRKRLRKILGL